MHVGGPVARAPAAGGGEQPAPRQDQAGVVQHEGEQRVLGRGQRYAMTIRYRGPAGTVQSQRSGAALRRRRCAAGRAGRSG